MLTDIEKIKLELGLLGEAESLLTDSEIQYFLDKNNGSIKKASLDVAKTVLFVLSQQVHERSGVELELYNNQWFENYLQAIKLYLSDPTYSVAITSAKAYAGGISVSDIRKNVDNHDNLNLSVDIGIPMDREASLSTNTNKNVFNPYSPYYEKLYFESR